MEKLLAVMALVVVQADYTRCVLDLLQIASHATDFQSDSVYSKMFFYSGKSLNDLGRYEDCNLLSEAKYTIFELSRQPWVVLSFCGPSSCSKEDYYSLASGEAGFEVHFSQEEVQEKWGSLSGGAVAMVTFISFLGLLVLIGSVAELASEPLSGTKTVFDKGIWKVFLCFSAVSNFKRVFAGRGTRDSLDSLNGIRVISISWVILGHVAIQYLAYSVCSNVVKTPDYVEMFSSTIIYGAFFAVDVFFWLSAFLMSYLMLKEMNARGFPGFFVPVVHRFLRITPLFLFVTFLFWSLQKYLGSGPVWYSGDLSNDDCYDYWWTNLTYTNNFVPDFRRNSCIGVGWYLANDMQFFILSLPVMYLYGKVNKWVGWGCIAGLNLVMVFSSLGVAEQHDLNLVMVSESQKDLMDYYYVKPYCRVGPYALGLASGFVMYSYKRKLDTGETYDAFALKIAGLFEKFWCRVGLFLAGLGCFSFLIFIQYTAYRYPGDNFEFSSWSRSENVAWLSLNRLFLGFSLTLMFLPLVLGYFSFIGQFLSWPFWNPFANLNFCVYLIHLSLTEVIYKSQKMGVYISNLNIYKDAISVLLLCFLVAVPIFLLVECPFGRLEKLFWESLKKKPKD